MFVLITIIFMSHLERMRHEIGLNLTQWTHTYYYICQIHCQLNVKPHL
jgi:hypothetical protein